MTLASGLDSEPRGPAKFVGFNSACSCACSPIGSRLPHSGISTGRSGDVCARPGTKQTVIPLHPASRRRARASGSCSELCWSANGPERRRGPPRRGASSPLRGRSLGRCGLHPEARFRQASSPAGRRDEQSAPVALIPAPALQEKTGFRFEREHVCGRPRALSRCG